MVTQNDSKNEISLSGDSRVTSLVGVFLILASIALYVFYVGGLSDKTDVVKASVAEATQKVAALQTQVAEFQDAEKRLGITSSVQKLELANAVPVGIRQDEVIKQILEIADMNDIRLNSIGFGKGSTGQEKIGSLQINAGFEGTYEDLVQFLEGLEQNRRTFRVNSISVQVVRLEATDLKKASFALSMDAFYQK